MRLIDLVVGPFAANCYIVGAEAGKEAMVIDAGAEAETILHEAQELGLEIKLIVATHSHVDHVGAVKELKEATAAPFAMHQADAEAFRGQGATMPTPLSGRQFPTPPYPDLLLEDGQHIQVGSLSFLVLHTPGHSPGGICLYGHDVVFSGDTLFHRGIGRFDTAQGNGRLLLEGIHTKLLVLPDETIVYPGHGPATTIRWERRFNPWLRA